jgi:hypothetical protein
MLDDKFVMLVITLIWMSGLFATVLTLASMYQERRKQRHNAGYTWNTPRNLAPLYCSLAIFCVGLALYSFAAQRPISLWMTIIWALLALFFAFRMFGVLFADVRQSRKTALVPQQTDVDPVDIGRQGGRMPIWTSVVLTLLLVSVAVLAWWGSVQINAGERGLPVAELPLGEATPAHATPVMPVLTPSQFDVTPSVPDETRRATNPGATNPIVIATLTPTPSLAPILVPTPTPQPAIDPFVTVRSPEGANVRAAPDLTAAIVTRFADATTAPVLGRTADSEWFLIRLPDETSAWISTQVVELTGVVESVPIVVIE